MSSSGPRHLSQRPVDTNSDSAAPHSANRAANTGEESQQLNRHPHPLRTLTREHERHTRPGSGAGRTPHHTRRIQSPPATPVRPASELRTVSADHHRPVLATPPAKSAARTPHQQDQAPDGPPVGLPDGPPATDANRSAWRADSTLGARRQHPRDEPPGRVVASLNRLRAARLGCRCLLQDDVGVGAADAERRHTRPARTARRPATAAASVSSSTAPADQSTCGDGSSDVQRLRQHAVPHAPAPS